MILLVTILALTCLMLAAGLWFALRGSRGGPNASVNRSDGLPHAL